MSDTGPYLTEMQNHTVVMHSIYGHLCIDCQHVIMAMKLNPRAASNAQVCMSLAAVMQSESQDCKAATVCAGLQWRSRPRVWGLSS